MLSETADRAVEVVSDYGKYVHHNWESAYAAYYAERSLSVLQV